MDSFETINDADQRDVNLKNEMVTILNLCIQVHEYTIVFSYIYMSYYVTITNYPSCGTLKMVKV